MERQNLTIRMACRCFTRLTNAFSKKLDNLKAALAPHFGWYNFVRIHGTLRVTAAIAAEVTDRVWELSDLLAAYRLCCVMTFLLLKLLERQARRAALPVRSRGRWKRSEVMIIDRLARGPVQCGGAGGSMRTFLQVKGGRVEEVKGTSSVSSR